MSYRTVPASNAPEPVSWWCSWLINDRISLKSQLISSFLLMTLISGGITLAICLGMLYGLGSTTYDNADNIIIGNSKSNSENIGNEISSAVQQQLRVIAESVCMVSSLYATSLLSHSYEPSVHGTMLAEQATFPEYNFYRGCQYPRCPKDFGPIYTRSRIPYLPAFQDGSTESSSAYLYSSSAQRSLRNDSTWNSTFRNYPEVKQVYEGLAYQDSDMNIMYNRGPNTTVMFYLSAQVFQADNKYSSYHVVHRTFPGIVKNDSAYDPSLRSWFVKAPVGGFNFYGPYRETFTKQLVVTLSSKQNAHITNAQGNKRLVSVVSGAVVLLKDLATIVNSVKYDYNGFGVLKTRTSNQVLVWGTRNDVYNEDTHLFKTIGDFDMNLVNCNTAENGVFEYTDPQGIAWIVSVNVFLNTANAGSNEGLTLLVFSQSSLVHIPLNSLKENIDSTTSSVSIETVIIVCATIGGVMLIVIALVLYITRPLEIMRTICAEVVEISAEDEDHRDYTEVVQKAYVNLSRTDEVGLLALDYYHILCMLQNKTFEKKNTPKYPANPFYIPTITNYATFSWESLIRHLKDSKLVETNEVQVETMYEDQARVKKVDPKPIADTGLDVLAAFTQEAKRNEPIPESPQHAVVPITSDAEVLGGGDIELAQPQRRTPEQTYAKVSDKASSTYYEITPTKPVGYLTSLKSQLYMISCILLAGMMITMIITVVQVHNEGATWTDDSTDTLTISQVQNIQEIANTKAKFVKTYFAQLSMDLLAATRYSSSLLDHQLTRSDWLSKQFYLASYSADTNNPYSAGFQASSNYSGYFVSTDAGCNGASCDTTHESTQTKLTSLLDLKYRSYVYNGNSLSFLQIALESNGYTRYFPYTPSSTNANPSTCLVAVTDRTLCANLYAFSRCASDSYGYYPAYEARCRPWYNTGYTMATSALPLDQKLHTYFQYPRISSGGKFVLAGIIPVHQNNSVSGTLHGVISSNFLASKLSDSINNLKVLSSGYCYLVDSVNASYIVLHPNVKNTACNQVKCAEGFSDTDYSSFQQKVLQPIQAGTLPTNILYTKGGKLWRVVTSYVTYDTVKYALLVTVPEEEVLQVSTDTQQSIDTTVVAMIIVFAFVIVLFAVLLLLATRWLIQKIVHPVDTLRLIFEKAKNEDYSEEIPTIATSLDMKILLEALSKLMIALRFGSDSYARGDIHRAKQVFTDAMNLYTAIHNPKGIGASLNNLAAVEMALKNYPIAEELYTKAIENATTLLMELEAKKSKLDESDKDLKRSIGQEIHKYTRLLSDRQGNLAVLYLEQNVFAKAFPILEEYLEKDKQNYYIKGCIIKQGTLGQYYIKQQEFKSADRILHSALGFMALKHTHEQFFTTKDWQIEGEVDAIEQIALYNIALLYLAQVVTTESKPKPTKKGPSKKGLNSTSQDKEDKESNEAKEETEEVIVDYRTQGMCKLFEALTRVPYMHIATVNKIFLTIRNEFLLHAEKNTQRLIELDEIGKEYEFLTMLDNTKSGTTGAGGHSNAVSIAPKRVVFAIDFSGSMAGAKIRSARENLSTIIEKHIASYDSVALIRFNSEVKVVFPLLKKEGNEQSIQQKITELKDPNASTMLYTAIDQSYELLTKQQGTFQNNWIIVLTDGEDNGSQISLSALVTKLASSQQQQCVDVIVVGIGADVQEHILKQIAGSTKKGQYVFAEGDKSSIEKAFQQVAQIIQGQVLLEDY